MKVGAVILLLMLGTLAACKTQSGPAQDGASDYDPHLFEKQRAACEKRGGTFAEGKPGGAFVCFNRTRDAGKACTAAKQCEGACLARSRTCAPIKPLFGCNEVLSNSGAISTVCVN